VLLYQIKKEMGIDLIENMHIEDAIKKIIEMVI
jgi:2-phosphoglycerate kinase